MLPVSVLASPVPVAVKKAWPVRTSRSRASTLARATWFRVALRKPTLPESLRPNSVTAPTRRVSTPTRFSWPERCCSLRTFCRSGRSKTRNWPEAMSRLVTMSEACLPRGSSFWSTRRDFPYRVSLVKRATAIFRRSTLPAGGTAATGPDAGACAGSYFGVETVAQPARSRSAARDVRVFMGFTSRRIRVQGIAVAGQGIPQGMPPAAQRFRWVRLPGMGSSLRVGWDMAGLRVR